MQGKINQLQPKGELRGQVMGGAKNLLTDPNWNQDIYNQIGPRWTPANLPNLALWLDPADPSTLTLVSGAVSEWRDKSGAGRSVSQATPANRPAYSATSLNGRPGLTFDGGNDGLFNLSAAMLRNLGAATIAGVSRRTANTAIPGTVAAIATATNITRANLAYRLPGAVGEGVAVGGRRLDADSLQAVGPNAFNSNYAINIGVWDYANATLTLFENGVQSGTRVFQTPGLTPNDGGALHIGQDATGTGGFLNGEIGDVFIQHTALSAADRQRLEGFLAHKYWGAGALNPLPSNHPFKNFPPVI